MISLDSQRTFSYLEGRLSFPKQIGNVTSIDSASNITVLDLRVPTTGTARLEGLLVGLASAPPPGALTKYGCEASQNRLSGSIVTCNYSSPNNSLRLRSVASVELLRTAGYLTPLSLIFLAMPIFTAIMTWFAVSIFGRRWSVVMIDKERLSVRLRTALDNTAHDFRSIVQSLRTELRILRSLPVQDSQEFQLPLNEVVGRLSRTVGQFDLITQDFRAGVLGKVGGDTSPVKVELYLPFVIRHVTEYHNSKRFSDKMQILANEEPATSSGCFVMAHLAQMNRLLGNLIDNAVEACTDSLRQDVLVSLETEGEWAIVRVSDTGKGIELPNLQSVFDSTFTTKGAARGQGLASCKEIVEDLGGSILVERSAPGSGTTFKISLPITPRPDWFVDTIVVSDNDVLVFIDDEEDMRDVWKARMKDRFELVSATINGKTLSPVLQFLSEPGDLRGPAKDLLRSGTRFFVDFRLKNYHLDGLSLIQEYGLQSKAILVTNHFHDAIILKRAVELGVTVLPKEFLSEVSFDIELGGHHVAQTAVSNR